MIENLEILEFPTQVTNGEPSHYKKGVSFILNGFSFSFDVNESNFFKFFESDNYCNVEYHSARFRLSNADSIALQNKIKELKE